LKKNGSKRYGNRKRLIASEKSARKPSARKMKRQGKRKRARRLNASARKISSGSVKRTNGFVESWRPIRESRKLRMRSADWRRIARRLWLRISLR